MMNCGIFSGDIAGGNVIKSPWEPTAIHPVAVLVKGGGGGYGGPEDSGLRGSG